MSEIKSCEHKQTIVVDNSLAEWCEDCGAFRIKTLNPWRWSEWYYPNIHSLTSVPSKEKILEVVMESEFYKNIIQYKEANNFTKELKNLVNDLHTLLTERK